MLPALERFFEAAGCRTQVELADFLGIKQSSIALAKKKGRIPPEWLLVLWRKKGVNPDWVLTGQGPKGLQLTDCFPGVQPQIVYVKEIRPPEECSIEEIMIEVVRRVLEKTNF